MKERLCEIFQKKGLPYGFGGIARLGYGMLPAEKVIVEHYRLGSTRAIVSRSFCNVNTEMSLAKIEQLFLPGIKDIRQFENEVLSYNAQQFADNRKDVEQLVQKIVESLG